MIKLSIFIKIKIKLERELVWNSVTSNKEKVRCPAVNILILKNSEIPTPIRVNIFFSKLGNTRLTMETITGIITIKNK